MPYIMSMGRFRAAGASRTRIPALLLGLALVLSACGTTVTEAAAPGAAEDSSVLVGEFQSIAADTVDLSEFQGEDVVLWFWAPW